MATQPNEPKQTNQGGEGRKDEKKGTDQGRDIKDQHTLAQAGNPSEKKQDDKKGGRNSQGGTWGKNPGGNDAHNKR